MRPRSFSSPSASISSSSGRPNARVFPVPVLACPMMSCPPSANGRVRAWMGKVVKMPAASRPEQIASLMPKSRKGTALVPSAVEAASDPGGVKRSLRLVSAECLSCQGFHPSSWPSPAVPGPGPVVSAGCPRCSGTTRAATFAVHLCGYYARCRPVREPAAVVRDTAVYSGSPQGSRTWRPAVNSSRIEQHDLWLCHSSRHQVYQEWAQPTRQARRRNEIVRACSVPRRVALPKPTGAPPGRRIRRRRSCPRAPGSCRPWSPASAKRMRRRRPARWPAGCSISSAGVSVSTASSRGTD